MKARTRNKRTGGKETRYQITPTTNIENVSLKQFLSHPTTKQDLTVYLTQYSVGMLGDKRYAITYDTVTVTNIGDFAEDICTHDHEEADTLLILHAIDVAKRNPFSECFVYSPDTDVFLLLLYYAESLTQVTFFRTGRGIDLRDINIHSCYEALGATKSKALLGFHTFTGCDQTGRLFNGISKTSWWKQFSVAENSVLDAFAQLGSSECLPSLATLEALESFVVKLYGGTQRPHDMLTIPSLRWFLFCKNQHDVERLPPTMGALKNKVFRSHYITLVLRRSHLSHQHLPNPLNYGWENLDNILVPIMTDDLPAPLALIELSVCKCKGSCVNRRCKCVKHNLVCTDMCKCKSCENDGNGYDQSDEDSDINVDSDDNDDEF